MFVTNMAIPISVGALLREQSADQPTRQSPVRLWYVAARLRLSQLAVGRHCKITTGFRFPDGIWLERNLILCMHP
jgi:hypothetical protein